MTDKQERRINIQLDRETHRKLRMEAVELDQPMNRIARNVLQNHYNTESVTREED